MLLNFFQNKGYGIATAKEKKYLFNFIILFNIL
jgi:hypothetical protein